ncbi:MAG: hypothetical protein L3J96_03825 [Thermoplasmata archaeon]|nr:hypothetical protein [Thermoplasmata archaeon]
MTWVLPLLLGILVLGVASQTALGGPGSARLGEPTAMAAAAFPALAGHPGAAGITVVVSINPSSVTAGTSASFQASVSGGTPPYTYTWSGLPSGCNSNGAASFSCSLSETGSYNVQVSVQDSTGAMASNSQFLSVTQSQSGGNHNGGGGSNNSSAFQLLPAGFLSVILIGVLLFYVLLALIAGGVIAIAVVLARRLPKPNRSAPVAGTTAMNAVSGSPCPACGATVPTTSRFCGACGKPIAGR